MRLIKKKCKELGLILIEDISEGVGVRDENGQLLGTYGDYACASLYANKIVHGGDGGFVLAQDSGKGPRLLSLVNHGFTPTYHFVHFEPATNAKINGLGAAMACASFDKIDEIIQHRRELAASYRKELSGLPLVLMPPCGLGDSPWVFGLVMEAKAQRTSIRKFLAEQGIETRDF